MIEERTLNGTLRYLEDFDASNLDLWGVVDFNGEEVEVKVNLTEILRDYDKKIIEITIKVIEEN